jgi:phosphoglycerol transferase
MVRAIQRRIPRLAVRRAFTWGLAGVLLIAGYVDQTPVAASTSYASTIERFEGDAAWIASVEASVPSGSLIVQLPYEPFPESVGPTGVIGSEVLIPYLHSKDLRWTGGGIKGRPRADWTSIFDSLDPSQVARFAAAAGADGIHIDRRALTQQQADGLESGLDDAIGERLVSEDGRWVFYPLAGVRAELEDEFSAGELEEFAALLTDPVTVTSFPAFVPSVTPTGAVEYVAADPETIVTLSSSAAEAARVRVEVDVRVDDARAQAVEIALPDGTVRSIELEDGVGSIEFGHVALPGVSDLRLTVTGSADGLNSALVLTRLSVFETALEPLLAR